MDPSDRDLTNCIQKLDALQVKMAAMGCITVCLVKPLHKQIVYKGNNKLIQWLQGKEEEFMSLPEFLPQGIQLQDRPVNYDIYTVRELRTFVCDILAKIPGGKVSWRSPKPLY